MQIILLPTMNYVVLIVFIIITLNVLIVFYLPSLKSDADDEEYAENHLRLRTSWRQPRRLSHYSFSCSEFDL